MTRAIDFTDKKRKKFSYRIERFDLKTGTLLSNDYRNDDGDSMESGSRKWLLTLSGYVQRNGFFFPKELHLAQPSGRERKYVIDLKTLKINEPFEDGTFELPLKPGAFVHDEIEGKEYMAPTIGNTGAEKIIAKQLDEIFEKANK